MANTHSIDLESTSTQYLSASDSASLSQTGDMTFECWVKFESLPTSGNTMTLGSKWDSDNGSNNGRGYIFRLFNNSGTYQFGMVTSSDGTGGSSSYVNYTPSTGTWYHVAMTYDASAGQVEVYVNGKSIGTNTGLTTSVYDNTTDFTIGCYRDTNGAGAAVELLDGLIDEVRLWSDIRTGTEINQYMGVNLDPTSAGLVAYWQLNNSLLDETSNNNDLTNNNSASFSTTIGFAYDTFWPNADTEFTSCDGQCGYENGSDSWSVIRNKTDGNFSDANTSTIIIFVKNSGAVDDGIGRAFLLFDTSALPDSDTISSVSLYITPQNVESDPNGNYTLAVTQSSPASNTAIVNADFDQCGSIDIPDEGATRVAHGGFTLNTQKEISLNSTGIGWVSKTGITKLGLREGYYDIDGNDPTSGRSGLRFYSMDNGNIENAPRLVITHSSVATFIPKVMIF